MAKDAPTVEPPESAVIDTALTASDWPLLHQLWRLGVGDVSVCALLRLRTASRRRGHPELDGFTNVPRLEFARWLVRQGRLNEAA